MPAKGIVKGILKIEYDFTKSTKASKKLSVSFK